jgi:hypothetical protein
MSVTGQIVRVGDIMPDCPVRLRPDGTCEHEGHVIDPVQLQVVLGADVSPDCEQAIIDAGRNATGSDGQMLWVWSAMTAVMTPDLLLGLHLRPGHTQRQPMVWPLRFMPAGLCDACVVDVGESARQAAGELDPSSTALLPAQIITVGRDHRVLSVTHAPCHQWIGFVWLVKVFSACWRHVDPSHLGPPPVPMQVLSHVAGEPGVFQQHGDLALWLMQNGWIESHQQLRLRRRRRHAAKRAGR